MMKFNFGLIRTIVNNKGMSLVEVMVVIAITGIITAAVGMLMVSNQRSANLAQNMVDIQMQGEQALKLISERVMEASEVIEKTANTEYWIKGPGTGATYTYHCFKLVGDKLMHAVVSNTSPEPAEEALSYTEAARFVQSFTMTTPITINGQTYQGAAIKLVFTKSGVSKTYGTQIYCRN